MSQTPSQSNSLTTQIIWRVGILSLIALIGIIVALVAVATVSLRNTQRAIRESATEISHALDRRLLEIEQETIALSVALSHTDAANYPDLFRGVIDQNNQGRIFRAHYINTAGEQVYEYERAVSDIPHPDLTTNLDAWNTLENPTWGEITWSEGDNPFWSVTLAAPVYAPRGTPSPQDGERLGTLFSEVDLTTFWDEVRVVDVGIGSKAYMIDAQEGHVLAHKNAEAALLQTTADLSQFQTPNAEDFEDQRLYSTLQRGLEGGWAITGVKYLENPPTMIVVEQPLSTALIGFYRVGVMLLVLAGVGVWLILSVGRFVQNRIIVPLELLHTHVDQFRQGDMSQRIYLSAAAGDEIDLLTRTFNRMADDIQTRTQELVVANQRAEEGSRLKTEFLSMISHELRTPLNAIMGYSGILLEGLNGEMDPIAKNMVSRIDLNSHRLLHLINELLDLSRIESGEMGFDVKPFNPHDLAHTWDEQHRVLAAQHNLDFVIQIDPALPNTLHGDTKRLTQIVANLLSNAFKFTKTGTITLALDYDITEWSITVRDEGIGISEEALNYIFEKFRQGDSSSTREYGGTGLGLTIVDQLTRMMGGRVTVDSQLNKGSRFTVHLPIITQSSYPVAKPDEATSRLPDRT